MKTTSFILGAIVTGLLAGCAELKEDLPSPVAPGVQVHDQSWVDTSSPGFHGAAIRANNWDMRSCQACHGATYGAGTVNSSCRDCHTESGGPENCATCHGSANPAPPRDLSKNTATTARGVGAHQAHLHVTLTAQFRCGECHIVPGAIYAPGHIDTSPRAEAVFNGPLSTVVSGNGTRVPVPSYDIATMRCNNTFCHGNFETRRSTTLPQFQFAYASPDTAMLGANFSPLWTGGSAEAACGTCHGLPPTGHVGPLTRDLCGNSGCHPGVVNAAGNIADPSKHINGKKNVQGGEYAFR